MKKDKPEIKIKVTINFLPFGSGRIQFIDIKFPSSEKNQVKTNYIEPSITSIEQIETNNNYENNYIVPLTTS
ncbi:MAG: hypothetical protein ACTSQO_13690 [Candidatus Helarchaeota archaeon]